ncbi:MAG: hypothetical protein ACK456_14975, partial [Pseudanabaenaceae cyanobacterium]
MTSSPNPPALPTHALVDEIDLLLRAKYPLLYLVSVEEEPVEIALQQVAMRHVPKRRLLFWDVVRGWSDNGTDKGSAMAALMRIGKLEPHRPDADNVMY